MSQQFHNQATFENWIKGMGASGIPEYNSIISIPESPGTYQVKNNIFIRDSLGNLTKANPAKIRKTCILIGNSIAGATYDGELSIGAYTEKTTHEVSWANFLAGGVLEYPEITATSGGSIGNISRVGCYSASGKSLAEINTDLETKIFLPLDTANITPEVVIAKALLENSIANSVEIGATSASIIQDINSFIAQISTKWPGIAIIFARCRPSFSINNSNDYTCFYEVNKYLEDIADGDRIFLYGEVTNGVPKSISCVGTINSSVLTVLDGTKLENGYWLNGNPSNYITKTGTNTYSVAGSPSNVSGTIILYAESDQTVHPTAKTALRNARNLAKILKCVAGVTPKTGIIKTAGGLTGSVSVSGTTGYTGTAPTQTIPQANSVATNTCLALNPGLRVTISNIQDNVQFALVSSFEIFNALAVPSISKYRTKVGIRIISGAEHIGDIRLQHRQTDNAVLEVPVLWWYTQGSNSIVEPYPDFKNGDEFIFCPMFPRNSAGAGTLVTAVREYIQIFAKESRLSSDTIIYEIFTCGIEIIS